MFFGKSARAIAERDARRIDFVGAQDGPVEQVLKDELARLLARNSRITHAFLARARIDGTATVVLAVRAEGVDQAGLARAVAAVFASIFNASSHLDVIFLTDEQVTDASRVCRPFYLRG